MLLPPNGLTLPVLYRGCESATRIRLSPRAGGPPVTVELADCVVPDVRAPGEVDPLCLAEETLDRADQVHLCLPLPKHSARLLAAYGEPLRGYVFINSHETLTQHMIRLAGLRRVP